MASPLQSQALSAILGGVPMPGPGASSVVAQNISQAAMMGDQVRQQRALQEAVRANTSDEGLDFDAVSKAALRAGDLNTFLNLQQLKAAGTKATAEARQKAMESLPVMARLAAQFPEVTPNVQRLLGEAGIGIDGLDRNGLMRLSDALADPEKRMQILSGQMAEALGFGPGTVVAQTGSGELKVLQKSDVLSPQAEGQKKRIAAAGATRVSFDPNSKAPPIYTVGQLAAMQPDNQALAKLARDNPNMVVTLDKNGEMKPFKPEKLTEGENKAIKFAEGAMRAEKRVQNIVDKYGMKALVPTVGEKIAGVAGQDARNLTMTPGRRQAEAAKKAWSESILRDRTGAAVTGFEYEDAATTYWPQLGDDDETIAVKAGLRADIMRAMASGLPDEERVDMMIEHQSMLAGMVPSRQTPPPGAQPDQRGMQPAPVQPPPQTGATQPATPVDPASLLPPGSRIIRRP